MNKITPAANASLSYNAQAITQKQNDKESMTRIQTDSIDITLSSSKSREQAQMIYQKNVLDALNGDIGQSEEPESPILAAYRQQADDGFDNMTPDNWTPEKVADRILKFTLGMFNIFSNTAENEGLSHDEVVQKFKDLVLSSVDKGYDQAIGAIGSVSDEVSSELSRTMELVHKGVDDWYKSQQSADTSGAETESSE